MTSLIAASYKHVSTKKFPEVLEEVSLELSKQKDQFKLST
jgi:hypothetical protein